VSRYSTRKKIEIKLLNLKKIIARKDNNPTSDLSGRQNNELQIVLRNEC